MEKDLFSHHADHPSPVGRMPRMDRPPVENDSLPDGPEGESSGCGCDRPAACVGYEGCGAGSWGLPEHPLAMVYAPCQIFRALYDTDTALMRGTLFTELDLPLGGEAGFGTMGGSCRMERRPS